MLAAIEPGSDPAAQPSALSEHPLIGKTLERYRVLSHIGSGGMADVYEVEHVALGRRLAMKVLRQTRSANPHLVRRFSREARAASRIDSEHVVGIFDYGALPEGQPYFVMELLRGQNLRQLLATHAPLPVVRVVNIAIDVCLGLHAAHAAKLVHRDLKPENLWLKSGDDGREICVLLDFGVARFDGAHTTGDGVLVGTARYMSPEQIGSEKAPGPPSDVFSLAVIMYEAMTGKAPFIADSLERTLFRILNETPAPLYEVAPDVNPELSAVLERALAKRADDRFASALELASALRPFAGAARPLPSLELAARPALSDDTLAESENDSDVRTGSSTERVVPAVSVGAPPQRIPGWLIGFGVGALFGVALFFLLRASPQEPAKEPKSATVIDSRPTPQLEPAPAVTAAQEAEPAAPANIPTKASSAPQSASPPPLRARVHAPTATQAPRSPSRPEPPRPNFDGRNPYFQ